jgi:hypothetical protein
MNRVNLTPQSPKPAEGDPIARFLATLTGVKTSGDGWQALCPAHEDHKASLSVKRGEDGRVLLLCRAGCEPDAIVRAVGKTFADLFVPSNGNGHDRSPVVATYLYRDRDGEVRYRKQRTADKQFFFAKPDGQGGWITSRKQNGGRPVMEGVERLPYRLNELRERSEASSSETFRVYVAEGEKDANNLWALDLPATTNDGGAGKWTDGLTQQLKAIGVTAVVCFPDNDDAGRAHMQTVARSCSAAGITVQVVDLPDLPVKGDVSDYLDGGHATDELLAVVEAARASADSPAPEGATTPATATVTGGLEFLSIRELIDQVQAAGPRRWLLRGLWPSRDYGIHAADMKAQKTWTTTDLSVSVASATAFLHHFPVDDPGPVLMFVGEGGKGNILRRLRADAEAHGVDLADLPITICPRAPHLTSTAHLADVAVQLAATRPRLVTLDPLYLSARGANLADLYAMGVVLETVQHLCDDAGAALWIVTHQNRKQGQGAGRILGAGPAEWGRVLLTAEVKARHTDPVSKATTVVTELSAIGGEIPDVSCRVRRRIWADDPDDLDSALHVETTVTEIDAPDSQPAADKLAPAAVKLLEAVRAVGPASGSGLVDWIAANHGHGLRRETVSRVLVDLERRGLVEGVEDGRSKLWSIRPVTCDITRPDHL